MLRFSHWVVAVGQVPSTGKAETGRLSPLPAMICPVTSWTNAGASAETGGVMSNLLVTSFGYLTSYRCDRV